jgi:hypothetical protein
MFRKSVLHSSSGVGPLGRTTLETWTPVDSKVNYIWLSIEECGCNFKLVQFKQNNRFPTLQAKKSLYATSPYYIHSRPSGQEKNIIKSKEK